MKVLLLGDSLELLADHRGKTPKKLQADYSSSGVPVASAIMVKNGTLDLSEARFVSHEVYARWMRDPVREGDVLLTSEAPLGRVARVPDDRPLVLGQRLFGLRGRAGLLDTQFLYYALQTERVQADLVGRATGTTVVGIRQSALKRVVIQAPSYSEQRAVAEVLGALDQKIVANSHTQDLSEKLAISMIARYQEQVPLSSLCSVRKSMVDPGSMDEGPVWHYSLPAFDEHRRPVYEAPRKIRSSKFRIVHPSVMISKLNPRFSRVWNLAHLREGVSVASTEFVVLEPVACGTSVLAAALMQPAFREVVEAKVAGTSGSHQRVRPDDLLATPVIDPRVLEPAAASAVTDLMALAEQAREESFNLANLRDTLLPELMSGKLRVKDAEQQAGEVL